MHVVILGCGRVGSLLAAALDELGHSVAIVDQDAKAFRKLGADFSGITVTGVGFDRQTLENAGIERAHAFAAVSSGDNTNILGARVARETYGVENVAARIYDPRRAEVYQRLGIPTVATVSWTTTQIMRTLLPLGAETEYTDPTGSMALAEVHIGENWIGKRTRELAEATGARVAFLTRYGTTLLPDEKTVVQDGDLVHLLFPPEHKDDVERICEKGPVRA
ncbi:MAG TPA: TrkA family potassium uptake protein [Candidatus Nanopelagicales bacterium]|nr:TrkA family potassium uptake protein [Candidatus Nanopelagicales bacterium]